MRDVPENWASGAPKRSFYVRLPPKLKIRTPKTSVFCETSWKNEDQDFQNDRFMRDFHENGNLFQKYCACHEIMTRGHTKCCTGHANWSSSSSAKSATLLLQNIGSTVRIPCACHVKRNPSNEAAANVLATSTKYCACHFLAPAT